MSEAPPIVEARGASRTLPGELPVTLVRDVSIAFRGGEFAAITGPSGSGKSSLLYLLGLLDTPSTGEVLVDGVPTSGLSDDDRAQLRLERIGFVFQFHFLLPEFTIAENVMIPMRRLGRLEAAAMRRHAEELLDRLGIADQRAKRPGQLSGGQRQRVAVARALANEPAIVLADEPTGSLDSAASAQVFALLQDIARRDGRAVVAVTHDLAMADRMDRRVHLIDGRIVGDVRQG
jgi:lipoprotein-releasing system ATP-binding protein